MARQYLLNFDDNAPDLMTHLGDFDELVGTNKLEDMVCVWRKDIIAECNWKLLLENAMETYHTGIVHAKTVGAQNSLTFAAKGEWHAIQVQSLMTSAVLDKTQDAPFSAN
ncbi:SRPBCC family protein [Pseudomonas aeruginosa]|nr:SRPBCC family protein [Pseudomonas aeruginosa]